MAPEHEPLEIDDVSLPPEFCRTRWREWVAGLVVISVLVLGASLDAFADSGWGNGPLAELPQAAPTPTVALTVPPPPNQPSPVPPNPGGWGTAPVATPVATIAPAEVNVRLVSGTRTDGVPSSPFNEVAARIRPTVVGIRTSLGPGLGDGRAPVGRVGSGVVVDPAGYAVTCRHVIDGATGILASRFREPLRLLAVQVLAIEQDLALLHILDSLPFESASLGDSDAAQVGDWVLAVGHPFGLGLTVTAGIIGNRQASLSIPGGGYYTGLLQTDAPINEGSSGGPLVDMLGRVIGINSAIYAPTGVFTGTGFAIPSGRVRALIERSLGSQVVALRPLPSTNHRVPSLSPSWGLGLVELDPSLGAQLPYSGGGVLVSSVDPGSPAAQAQLARGDIIVSVAGRAVSSIAAVQEVRSALAAGEPVALGVWRQGRIGTLILSSSATQGAG